jgi:phosphoribosyl 1,2-cyclic phosphodiesterase
VVRFFVLGSGSAGNALLVESGGTRVLVDCGFSGVELARRMQAVGAGSPEGIDALVLTHSHGDHASGAAVVARRYQIPIYTTPGTKRWIGNRKIHELATFMPGDLVTLGSLRMTSIGLSHDSPDTVALRFDHAGGALGICTDLGEVSREVELGLAGCDFVHLESNHDVAMLKNGPYPARLKKRILGRYGHISNEESADLVARLIPRGLRTLVLAHLSETNNTPETALRAVAPLRERHPHVRWHVAPQHVPAAFTVESGGAPAVAYHPARQLELL